MKLLLVALVFLVTACGEAPACSDLSCALNQNNYFGTVSLDGSTIRDTLDSNSRNDTLADALTILKEAHTWQADVVVEFYAPVGPGGNGLVARAHLFSNQKLDWNTLTPEAGWAAYCTYGFGCPSSGRVQPGAASSLPSPRPSSAGWLGAASE